jgi:dihydrolipoamide dehydrogenase
MEFATLWNRYGAKVTVVELLPRVLPLEDADISAEAQRQFKRAGIGLMTGARVDQVSPGAHGAEVTVTADDGQEVLSAEVVLVAIGFVPNSGELGLETVGVATDRDQILIDNHMCTNIPGIYAVGDVTGKLGLAHAASAQGMAAAAAIAGRPAPALEYVNIPRCTYAYPEVASVGLTEEAAKERGVDVTTAVYPFLANGKALAMADNKGFVKLVSDAADKRILGVHIIGGHVTELIAGPTGMLTMASTADELTRSIHPHPTLSEAVMEAAHMLTGHAVHG